MAKTHNVVARIRYTQGGEEKSRWLTIGSAFDGEKGQSLKLDTIPVGPWDGWLYLMTPKEADTPAKSKQRSAAFDDDAPF